VSLWPKNKARQGQIKVWVAVCADEVLSLPALVVESDDLDRRLRHCSRQGSS